MGRDGKCTVCHGKCRWDFHRNQPYVYVIKTRQVTKTSDELKRRYDEAVANKQRAMGEIRRFETVLGMVKEEIDEQERKLVSFRFLIQC